MPDTLHKDIGLEKEVEILQGEANAIFIKSILLRIHDQSHQEGFEDGLSSAAMICENSPQRLTPMDISVRLRQMKGK